MISGFSLTWHRKGSRDSAKRRGESGHPCRIPLVIGNESKVTPLALILADGSEYAAEIQLLPNPTCVSVENLKFQLTRSNAFSGSVPMKTLGVLVMLAVCNRFSTLVVLSLASLVGTKSTWSRCIR